ncbi:MAG TPA: M56 family metallopeptidase [Mucilaginibacter sp.]
MITYLVNSTLCSALLLAGYHLLLKNKAMYNFNRFYLLVSILFSLGVPLIVVHHNIAPLQALVPMHAQVINEAGFIIQNSNKQPSTNANPIDYRLYAYILVYGLVTFLLLFRLIRNLYAIRSTISQHEKVSYKGAQLVLIGQRLTPHTFLNYIFLNIDDYYQRQIENELLQHELAHARQCHSADIILTELVQAFCWFNPFLILYRKAIQVNHEFIADAAALNDCNDLSGYQSLLLSRSAQLKSLNITSQFNYSITKKRLIMMSKTTSATTAWCARLTIIPVIVASFMLFCNKTDAQQPKSNKQADQTKSGKHKDIINVQLLPPDKPVKREYPSTKNGISPVLMDEYMAYEKKYAAKRLDFSKTITQPEQKRMEQLFQQMSKEQQKNRAISFTYPPEPLPESVVSREELDSWADPSVYGVWIDGKRVKNSQLKHRQPEEFNMMLFSRLTDKAVKNDKFHYQITLMTLDYYKKYREQAIANRNNSMIMFHLKS